MGLSDPERVKGLYFDIQKMYDQLPLLKGAESRYKYDRIIELVEGLWHAFLGVNHNDSHWILGSSASNVVKWDSLSPWGVALSSQCDGVLSEKEDPLETPKDTFDAFEGFLNVEGLLRSAGGNENMAVYLIYAWSEQSVYHLRRYEDELLKGYKNLDRQLSDIQGECFDFFSKDEVFPKAYILNKICKELYCSFYPYQKEKWDFVTLWLQKQNVHHDLNRPMQSTYNGGESLKWLAEMHMTILKGKKHALSPTLRVMLALQIAGRRYHYDHNFKELCEMLKKEKMVYLQEFKKQFEANKKAHEKNEKNSQESYNKSQMSERTLYGVRFDD